MTDRNNEASAATAHGAVLELVLITGMSGSGKSIALHALEDAGYYCVDNLPSELIVPLVELQKNTGTRLLAIAVDVRSATSLPQLPAQLDRLAAAGVHVRGFFLEAATSVLVRRYSETRRLHPLSRRNPEDPQRVLIDAIELERELLARLREHAQVIDTGALRASQLQRYVTDAVALPLRQLNVVFESFAFKHGVPLDADYVFDVRMLPNPYYEPGLRELTGLDEPVAAFLHAQPDVERLYNDIETFLRHWIGQIARSQRSYVTVALGCTGGQHRSVYLVQRLAESCAADWPTLQRHRELDGQLQSTGGGRHSTWSSL